MTSLRAKIVAGSFVPLVLAAATLSLANDLGHALTAVEAVENPETPGVAVDAFGSMLAALRARVPASTEQRRRLDGVESAFDRWRLRPSHARLHAVTGALREFTHAEADAMGHRIDESRGALVAHGGTLGVLHLTLPPHARDAALLGGGTRRRLVALAEPIALSLSNLRLQDELRQQSVRDPLTGLYNRRYLTEALEREIHRAARRQGTTALIAFDVDHFKRFNDNFGHDAGDHVLREIARTAAARLRAGDVLCRHGGEEFVVLLPDAGAREPAARPVA